MVGKKRQRQHWKRIWYIVLITLFLLGLTLGIHLSQRLATETGQTPEPAPASSPQPPDGPPESGPQTPAPSKSPTPAPSESSTPAPSESPDTTPSESPGTAPSESPDTAPPESSAPPSTDPPPDGSMTGSAPPSQTPSESLPAALPASAQGSLESMDLREKICQMFLVDPVTLTGEERMTQAGERFQQALAEYPVGGLLFDTSNMVSQEQIRSLLETAQSCVRVPLILTCDEEGGRVSRLMRKAGTTKIGPMLDYAHLGSETAAANARTIAGDMVSCGFNTDLAPVADVWSNPDNTVIGDRAYSRDFAQAAMLIPAAVEGFHEGGVACTLKHFPGHGDTAEDSHTGAAYVNKTLEQLWQEELQPFRAGIAAGADMVMLGHLTVPEVDSEPAPFSDKLVTGLLREELGFSGVVITDSLQMKAVTDRYSSATAAVKVVQAGVDLLLCPENLEEAVNALLDAVEQGEISAARIDESVLRILNMKQTRGILNP